MNEMSSAIFWIYIIGYIFTSIFVWYSLSHVGVYFYHLTRIHCIRGHVGSLLWPLLPVFIWINEVKTNRYFSLSFEERMKLEGRVKTVYTDSSGKTWEAWGFPESVKANSMKVDYTKSGDET